MKDHVIWIAMTVLLIVMTVCMISLRSYTAAIDLRLERLEGKVDLMGVVQGELVKTAALQEEHSNVTMEDTGNVASTIAENATVDANANDIADVNTREILVSFSDESDVYAMRVLTAEAGADLEMCYAVAQCMFNACDYEGWEYSPAGICLQYGYTGPADWISDEAAQAYDDIFCCGVTYLPVEDAQFFYATKYCTSSWHETMRFITEIHGVRFFGRW